MEKIQRALKTSQCYRNLLLPLNSCNADEMVPGSKCSPRKLPFCLLNLLLLFVWYIVLLKLLQDLGNFCGHQEVQVQLPDALGDPVLWEGPWMRLILKAKISSPSCLLFGTSTELSAILTMLFSTSWCFASSSEDHWGTALHKACAKSNQKQSCQQERYGTKLGCKRGLLSSWGLQGSARVCPGAGATRAWPCWDRHPGTPRPTALVGGDLSLQEQSAGICKDLGARTYFVES